jgi:hypothetical protein
MLSRRGHVRGVKENGLVKALMRIGSGKKADLHSNKTARCVSLPRNVKCNEIYYLVTVSLVGLAHTILSFHLTIVSIWGARFGVFFRSMNGYQCLVPPHIANCRHRKFAEDVLCVSPRPITLPDPFFSVLSLPPWPVIHSCTGKRERKQ